MLAARDDEPERHIRQRVLALAFRLPDHHPSHNAHVILPAPPPGNGDVRC